MGSSLSAGEERGSGTVPPAGARAGVQLSHTKACAVEGRRKGKGGRIRAAFVADGRMRGGP